MTYEPILRGAKIKVIIFLLAACVLSASIVVMNSRPTRAESILYTVTCVVGGLLRYDCPKPAESATPAPTQHGDTSSQATSPTDSSTPTSSVQTVPVPISFDEDLHKELLDLPAVQGVATARLPAHVVQTPTYALGRTQQLATSSAIVASEEGWKILGIAWYWWGLMLGTGVGAWYALRAFILKARPSSL